MKQLIASALVLLTFAFHPTFSQNDLTVGPDYKLNIQRQTGNADAYFMHNAKLDASYNEVYRWETSHSMFGSRGMRFSYLSGIHFFADAVPTNGGSVFTPTTRFFVGNNGNIGIGTVTPWNKLHVLGAIGDSNTGIIRLDAPSANASLRIGVNTDYSWIQSHGSRPLYVNELGNNTILNWQGGNVGIGTTTPTEKLTVKGRVFAQEVKVVINVDAPDYVFEKDYKLPSLDEIKSYIDQHKHLPEVPSAKEMEQNGINLSEMNMILLKKVEELTLHAIEQNQKIAKLEEERATSPDLSGKKVEELTLQLIRVNQTVNQLNATMAEQAKTIDEMKRKLK